MCKVFLQCVPHSDCFPPIFPVGAPVGMKIARTLHQETSARTGSLGLSLPSYVTLSKSPRLYEPWFPHLQDENRYIPFTALL